MKIKLIIISIFLFPVLAYSAGITWINNSGGNWTGPGNWDPAGVPSGSSTVVIPDTVSSCTITMNITTGTTIASLTMNGTGGNTHTLSLSGDLLIYSSVSVSSLETINLGSSNLSIWRNLCLNGAIKGTGILTFNGGVVQNVSVSSNQNLGKVEVSEVGTVVSLLNSAQFTGLSIASGTIFKDIVPGTTVTIVISGGGDDDQQHGETFLLGGGLLTGVAAECVSVSGTLTLQGNSWGPSSVSFKSNSATTQFVLSKQTGSTLNLAYVSISGCMGVSNIDSIVNLSGCTVNNLGNNLNIKFPPRSWITTGISNWVTANNWSPPAAPNILDDVIINITNTNVTNASGRINSLTIGTVASNYCTLSNSPAAFLSVMDFSPSGVTVGSYGYINNVNIYCKGNMISSKVSLMMKNLTLSGNLAQNVSLPLAAITETFIVNNTGDTVTLANTSAETLFCNNITVNPNSTLQINAKTVRITGNALFNGTVLADSSTKLMIYPSTRQTLTAGNNYLGNIFLQTGSSSATLYSTSNLSFDSLLVGGNVQFMSLNSGKTITASSPAGITVQNTGRFICAGGYGSPAFLNKSGGSFNFKLDDGAAAKFANTYISNCNASVGNTVNIPYNCQTWNSSNFVFSALVNAKTWNGDIDENWTEDYNWGPVGAPMAIDDILITSAVNINNASGTIASLTLTNAAALTISTLTVDGHCTVASGSFLKAGNLYIRGNAVADNIDLSSSGNLFLSGAALQIFKWGGESWNMTVQNTSSSGVSSISEIKCRDFSLSSNAKYNQGDYTFLIGGSLSMGTGSGFSSNCNITVTGSFTSSGACTLGNGNTYLNSSLSVNGGNFNQSSSNLIIKDYFTVGSGSFTQGIGNLTIEGNVNLNNAFNQGSGNIYYSGNYIYIAVNKFNKGSGMLVLNRTGNVTLNANTNDLGRVEIAASATDLNLNDYNNNVKFTSLLIPSGSSLNWAGTDKILTLGETTVHGTLNFSGRRVTLLVQAKPDNGISVSQSGKLRFTGTSGTSNYASLFSSSQGGQFKITASVTDNISLRYARIRDCDASAGEPVEGLSSIDLGNNSNVLFGANSPADIDNLKIRQTTGSGRVELTWTAVGAEGKVGRADGYIVKYSAVNITTQEQFDSVNTYIQNWVPKAPDDTESYILTGLPQTTDIWFVAVEAVNFGGLQGDISQISEFIVQIDPARAVAYSLPGERGNVNIEIPQGAFTQSVEITGRELNSSQMPAVSQPEFKSTGLGASFSVSTAEKIKQPLKLKIKYDEKDIEGLNADKLKIAFYNDAMGKWYHIKSNVDSVNRRVCADLKHLTTFRVVEYTYLGLSTVKVFPNPWKIGTAGNFDNGELTFKNLPDNGRIRIYNIAGEMIKDVLITGSDDGFYSWNGTNDAGKNVSSGVYMSYVEDNDGNHRIMKIAVIR